MGFGFVFVFGFLSFWFLSFRSVFLIFLCSVIFNGNEENAKKHYAEPLMAILLEKRFYAPGAVVYNNFKSCRLKKAAPTWPAPRLLLVVSISAP